MLTKMSFSNPKFRPRILPLFVAAILLAGCTLPISPNPTAVPSNPTAIPPTSISAPSLETPSSVPPTAVPPTTIPPTQTPLLSPTPNPVTGNVVFASGTTAAVVNGTVQPGQVQTYTVSAGQLQPMILILDSPNKDVTFGVLEPNGNILLDPAKKFTRWQAWLPQTEVYTIQVIGGASTENFTLTIKVAQLVNFASGSSSITLSGKTVNGYVFSYGVSAKVNQTMTVSLNVPSSTAYLDVFGIATGTLLSPTAKANAWSGVLPETQEYVIEVIPNNGLVVNYSITITIPPSQTPLPSPNPTPVPGSVVFTTGTTAAVVKGTVSAGQVLSYTVSATSLQPMILILESPHKDVTLGLLGTDGSILVDPAKYWTRWQAWLPKTGTYTIQVVGGASTDTFTLTIKIAQVVNFASGSTSITLAGKTINGYVFSYAVNAKVNQTMTVTLNVPSTTAYLDIFGIATGTLLKSCGKSQYLDRGPP